MGVLAAPYPAGKLVFRKEEEKLPFMACAKIERVAGGGNAAALWECLYLDTAQVDDLLAHVERARGPRWVYVMFCAAAHTGMRRSELVRARVEGLDFEARVVTVREKKRVRGRLTTRRVPMTDFLEGVLKGWLRDRPGGVFLFGKGERAVSTQVTQEFFRAAVAGSWWEVMAGYHVLRHSFISACATRGVDQRLLQEWSGHMDEKTSRRYRHLWPSTQRDAINRFFG